MPDKELRSVPLQVQAPSYPAEIVHRALELVAEHGVIYRAHNILKAEMARQGLVAPAWGSIWRWAKEHEDVISRMDAHEKRNMDRLAGEVAQASAEKLLIAIEDDPKVTHAQRTLDYGISMDKVIGLNKAGQGGTIQAVQINLVGADGKRIGEV